MGPVRRRTRARPRRRLAGVLGVALAALAVLAPGGGAVASGDTRVAGDTDAGDLARVSPPADLARVSPPASPPGRQAPGSPEERLAARYAPVLRFQQQEVACGPGEPYQPLDVETVLGNVEVAFRGPWDRVNLVSTAPTGEELREGYRGYHLDFPGDALGPGCTYERWGRDLEGGTRPTTYARVVTQADRPGRLALQYWFFYVFNDYNNTHEGDWEMVQLDFAADDARDALGTEPTTVGYSQHSGAERASWGGEKLQVVDGTHPVAYPAAGSHANYYDADVFLGRTGDQGVGCDDTTGPHRAVRPEVAVVPTGRAAYLDAYPWLGFEGRWGEMQEAFFDGPTGPNEKTQWTRPVTWSESWRGDAFAVPLGDELLGSAAAPTATEVFCDAVELGSDVLREVADDSTRVLVVALGVLAVVLALATRTRWGPVAPLPFVRRRAWGQMVVDARVEYARRPRLYLGIGSVYVLLMVCASAVQWVLFRFTELNDLADVAGDTGGYPVATALLVGAGFSFLAYLAVLAATAWSLAAVDRGEDVTVRRAARAVAPRVPALALAAAAVVAAVAALNLLVVTVPVAVFLLVRRQFFVQAVAVERLPARAALARSRTLVIGTWWRTALVSALVVGLAALLGPLVGVGILLAASGASFGLVNLVSGLVYAVTVPYVGLVLAYLYADLRARADARPDATSPAAGPGAPAPATPPADAR